MNPIVFKTPQEAALYIANHKAENARTVEWNKENPLDKRGTTGIEAYATNAAPGHYKDAAKLSKERLSPDTMKEIRGALTSLEERAASVTAKKTATHAVVDAVEGVAKVVSHSKVGKAITAGGALLGAITGANASTFPQAGKDFAKAAVGAMDPTALVGPSIAEHALSKAIDPKQQTEFDKMGIDTGKIGVQKNAVAIATFNSRIDREEKFLMSAEHPAQLSSLKFKDKNGQNVDVEKALKDPAQRATVMTEIDRREAAATTPEMKQLYQDMKEAAQTFAAMEDRRKPMPPDIIAAQKAQPQPAAPAMAG